MPDRRCESRFRVYGRVALQGRAGDNLRVTLLNLSAHGCQFVSPDDRMDIGSHLVMTLGPVGSIDATVVWRKGDLVGTSFERPLQPAMVEHIRQFLDAGRPAIESVAARPPGQPAIRPLPSSPTDRPRASLLRSGTGN